MRAPRGTIKKAAKRPSAPAGPKTVGDDAEAPGSEKSDAARRAILDAAVVCFTQYGWGGTNMSVIARHARMTRGRIQYYFPTLDDLLRAAIDHLMVEWRRKYFGMAVLPPDAPGRLEHGIDVLWRLMQDPLHIARQELEASARTNPVLRAMMQSVAVGDEEASLAAARATYPELATYGDEPLRRARNFTNVFMEGLALYRFGPDAEARQAEMIDMLKGVIIDFWRALGAEAPAPRPAPNPPVDAEARRRGKDAQDRVLALLREATALLATDPGFGRMAD